MSTILITGANRGIGLELTQKYAADGWEVLACCRNPEEAKALQKLSKNNSAVQVHRLDVTSAQQITSLAGTLKGKSIDILLNNAGYYGPKNEKLGKIDYVEWAKTLEINTIAPLIVSQAFISHVAASEQKVIATVSSKMGSIQENTSGGSYVYRSSKTAVNQVMKSLSIDLKDQGITVIILHPGWVQTDMGGPNALINTDTSTQGLKKVLDGVTFKDSGTFINYDSNPIPW